MADEGALETFTERFVRLTAALSRKELGQILDLTPGAVLKLLNGDTQSLKAHGAIALARKLGVPVEVLAERGPLPRDERRASIAAFTDGLRTRAELAAATPPAASAEMEPRLPAALRELVEELRGEIQQALTVANNAQATADEAKRLSERRGRKTA